MEAKLTAGFSREERELLLDFLTRIYCNLNENERNDKEFSCFFNVIEL